MDAGVGIGIAIAIGFPFRSGFLEYMETVVPPSFVLNGERKTGNAYSYTKILLNVRTRWEDAACPFSLAGRQRADEIISLKSLSRVLSDGGWITL